MSDYICPYNCSYRTNSGFCESTGGYDACQYRLIAQKPKLKRRIVYRDAYPTRLSTTDEEESKIDQTSATIDDPLQSKEVFFDNKRMLNNQKQCDGLTLMWKRKNRTYYSANSFPVRFSEKGGICTLSFKQYVVEEDIENVLFSIINA